jgi:hypothetical protein
VLAAPALPHLQHGRHRKPLLERIAAPRRERWTGTQIGLLRVVHTVTFSHEVELKTLQLAVDRRCIDRL